MRIAVVPGDGIGPEVTREALKVLGAIATVAIAEGMAPSPTRVNSRSGGSTREGEGVPAVPSALTAEA